MAIEMIKLEIEEKHNEDKHEFDYILWIEIKGGREDILDIRDRIGRVLFVDKEDQ